MDWISFSYGLVIGAMVGGSISAIIIALIVSGDDRRDWGKPLVLSTQIAGPLQSEPDQP